MKNFYRIRALVDSGMEEKVCEGASVNAAMIAFEQVESSDSGEKFGTFGIDVAMIHKITFGENSPLFEDVTGLLGDKWARTSYEQAIKFYDKAKAS